jgi:hypothetical protein
VRRTLLPERSIRAEEPERLVEIRAAEEVLPHAGPARLDGSQIWVNRPRKLKMAPSAVGTNAAARSRSQAKSTLRSHPA